MSVDYSAKIVIAVPYKEIKELFDNSDSGSLDFYDWIEDNGLIQFPPYFDAHPFDCLCGVELEYTDDYGFKEIYLDTTKYLEDSLKAVLHTKFPDLNWKTYLTTIGW